MWHCNTDATQHYTIWYFFSLRYSVERSMPNALAASLLFPWVRANVRISSLFSSVRPDSSLPSLSPSLWPRHERRSLLVMTVSEITTERRSQRLRNCRILPSQACSFKIGITSGSSICRLPWLCCSSKCRRNCWASSTTSLPLSLNGGTFSRNTSRR